MPAHFDATDTCSALGGVSSQNITQLFARLMRKRINLEHQGLLLS